eukprot:858583-Rhodomonas_salina.1
MPSHRHSSLPLFSLALILASVYYADGFQLSLSTFSRTTLASVHANRPAATFRLALRPSGLIRGGGADTYGRRFSIVAARMSEGEKEMTEAERKEYEELLKQAQQLQGTFDSMIGGTSLPPPTHTPQPLVIPAFLPVPLWCAWVSAAAWGMCESSVRAPTLCVTSLGAFAGQEEPEPAAAAAAAEPEER